MSEVVLETERLIARAWRVDDAEGAIAMYGDPEVVRHIGGELITDLGAQRQRIAAIIERNETLWAGRYGSWPLFEKQSGELVGTAIQKPMPASGSGGKWSEEIEIGWHLARRHWGRGLATETGRGLLGRGFDLLGLDRLHAVVDSPNHRSLAVARRLGMRHTGKTARYYDQTLELFELSAKEWGAAMAAGGAPS